MSEMLERAARALIRRRAAAGDSLGPPLHGEALERYVDGAWRYWTEDVRTVIEAIREPDKEVLNAPFLRKRLPGNDDWWDQRETQNGLAVEMSECPVCGYDGVWEGGDEGRQQMTALWQRLIDEILKGRA